MKQQEKMMAQILKGMIRKRHIGARHTSEDNVPKFFPRNMRGDAKDALSILIRKGFVSVKPTHYGREISINPDAIEEIKSFICENEF